MKKSTFKILFLLLISNCLFGTPQRKDLFIFEGDTLSIDNTPLEFHEKIDSLRSYLFESQEKLTSTDCYRNYQAEWIIINNVLFLNNIYSCSYSSNNIKTDLEKVFGEKCKNGRVKADWFTGRLIAPKGRMLFNIGFEFGAFYEKEQEFEIFKGKLINSTIFDNSKSRQSIYSANTDTLRSFIYKKVDWSKLPEPDSTIRVFIQYSADENGIIDSVKVLRGYKELYEKEALKIVTQIPEWDIYYRLGKPIRIDWTLAIVFSKQNKEKYFEK